jgi:hypothetical protein
MRGQQFQPVRYEVIQLKGGLDLVTPTLSLKPGVARDAVNYEVSITGGYTRIAGYERYDGRPNPSDAIYTIITVGSSAALAVGNTITNLGGTVSGKIIVINGTTVVFTKSVGSFTAGDNIYVSGVLKTTCVALGGSISANNATAAQYAYLAAEEYRKDIGAVPGSGPIRGIEYYNGTVYAWRDNAGGTALTLNKSTGSGWTAVSLGEEISFSNANTNVGEGDTLTQGGVTATIKRVVLETGTLASGTNAGRLILSGRAGGNFAAGAATSTGAGSLTLGGAQTAITLLPGGRVETVIANFGGSTNSTRMYGCDGMNRAFEFDGTVYVPIKTGMTVDAPQHIAFHKQHLFLSFGSSLQYSSLGYPYQWSVVLGAGEIAVSNAINDLLVQPGDQSTGAMAIYTESDTFILYGTSSSDWNLVSYNVGTGAKAYTAQNLNQSYVMNDRGVMNMATTLNYGNFDTASLTLNIRPWIQQRRNLATGSSVNREKGQYRIFFSDGYGLYLTTSNGQMLGAMPVQFPNPVSCICAGESPDGTETSFFGSTNGYVYRLDAGTSFDGAEISANIVLNFNAIGSPRVLKRFRKGSLEITGTGYAEFAFSYDLGYSSPDITQDLSANYSSNLVASFWDQVFWDNFVWDGRTLAPSEVEVKGTAENIAVRIASISAIYPSFTINSVILHYSMRRGLR